MSDNDERVNSQLIRFFEKVILNTANTYYKKQEEIQKHEQLDQLPPYLFTKDTIKFKQPINVLNVTLLVEDIKLAKILPLLKEPEQIFLIEKFIFDKTDKEIGKVLGITRQGATNLKHRLYKKIQKMLV
ncbi:sigma-70 family RNA polymerase sigma factor [Enterococcus faecium]|nr:sigma-70 family RNA polymerase sigma factor [Enterococcus faecium]